MGIIITIVLIILLIILVISLFAAIFETIEKVEKFAKSTQEHISSFKRYEKDIKILEDNSNYKIKELEGKMGELEEQWLEEKERVKELKKKLERYTRQAERLDFLEKERKNLLNIMGEYNSEKNEYAIEHNYKDCLAMTDTVQEKIKEIFKEFLSEEELEDFKECSYENIPWALERIRLNMKQIELEKEQVKAEIKGEWSA